jgi:hypothetical protein
MTHLRSFDLMQRYTTSFRNKTSGSGIWASVRLSNGSVVSESSAREMPYDQAT